MSKFKMGVVAAGFTLVAFASPAFAIGSAAECQSEGGDMLKVKGSDFCLVPIRPEEYKDPVYDGNQLGVVDCPGNKLNDGVYCMYPVSLRNSSAASTSATSTTTTPVSTMTSTTSTEMATPVSASETMSATEAKPMSWAEKRAAKRAAKEAEKAAKKVMDAAK